MNIKDYSVRAIKKGKKRGRPSKQERTMSAITSFFFDSPKVQKYLKERMMEIMLYGSTVFDHKKFEKLL